MTRKVRAGQAFRPPSMTDHNLIADMAEWYRSKILGEGGSTGNPLIPTDIIKVKNSSGAARRQGEVLETVITGLLVTDVEAGSLWIDADLPSDLVRWGILRHELPDDEIGEMQVSGACKAIVDIQTSGDPRAGPMGASAVLESGATGPLKILYAPAATGEQDCIVLFHDEPTVLASIAIRTRAAGVPGRIANAMGSAVCDVLEIGAGAELCFRSTATIYNISDDPVGAYKVGLASPAITGDGSRIYIVVVESCNDGGFDAIVNCV